MEAATVTMSIANLVELLVSAVALTISVCSLLGTLSRGRELRRMQRRFPSLMKD